MGRLAREQLVEVIVDVREWGVDDKGEEIVGELGMKNTGLNEALMAANACSFDIWNWEQ